MKQITRTSTVSRVIDILPCPQCDQGIDLSNSGIGGFTKRDKPLLKCKAGHKFSFSDAISKAAGTQHVFQNLMFVSDAIFVGRETTQVGKLSTIKLPDNVRKLNYVTITPHFIPGYRSFAVPWGVNDPYFSHENIDSFHVLTSVAPIEGETSVDFPKTVTFEWAAYAVQEQCPAWKELLHRAKHSERIRDYRTAVIEADSAFETFVTEILAQKLNEMGIPPKIVTRILDHRGEKMSWVEGLFPKFRRSDWNKKVAEPRNKAMHKGDEIKESEASECFKAIFEFLSILGADVGSFVRCKLISCIRA